MPIQLSLLGDDDVARPSIWKQLPVADKERVCGLFAELLIAAVTSGSPKTQVTHDESHEDPVEPSRP